MMDGKRIAGAHERTVAPRRYETLVAIDFPSPLLLFQGATDSRSSTKFKKGKTATAAATYRQSISAQPLDNALIGSLQKRWRKAEGQTATSAIEPQQSLLQERFLLFWYNNKYVWQ
ncbi:hypothetical protein M513_11152 [Trichuris suis]|uniref:Uncharacterized protein n=1 Tax=Trichuris suis TaxID=68888 RepID=A0A085LSM9_9BILA|nr:hypothetical protein M513_11152 [Trichuris suis]